MWEENAELILFSNFLFPGRKYSTLVLGDEFYEWLAGFTDGEGSFHISKNLTRTHSFTFKFRIGLHVDDLDTLKFIQKVLGIGSVTTSGNMCDFTVGGKKDLEKILVIFTKHQLNSTKHLNFLDFKKAFELYHYSPASPSERTSELSSEIDKIRDGMNTKRSEWKMPVSHEVRITPYWLLGFVEGEGSFFTRQKEYQLTFSISQDFRDLALMKQIREFLNNLGKGNHNAALLFSKEIKGDLTKVTIIQKDYIKNILIPFFDAMTWRSKKAKDYLDWKTILKFKELGLHYTEEGVRVINLILSQMNNNRLSTASLDPSVPSSLRTVGGLVNRTSLEIEIDKLLEGGSNFVEMPDGKIWIKSLNKYYSSRAKIKVEVIDENGNILNTFDSLTDCAKDLGVSWHTVANRLQNLQMKPLALKEGSKVVYIRKLKN